uniref:Uncharacterized protein n=1 Tax=Avena sativa TaxID=4498 RepID=A0ACD5ZRY2_AVESA
MNVDRQAQGGLGRRILIRDAGWPSWGSDKVIFFHRGIPAAGSAGTRWRVFRYDLATGATDAVTPEDYFVAITPAAISETKVAVATIRRMSKFSDDRVEAQYRHIEVFDVSDDVRGGKGKPLQVTSGRRPKADHYNPFVLDGGRRVGYHRCRTDRLLEIKDESQTNRSIERKFDKVRPPASHPDVGLFRVSGVFPTVSKDGRKLAFVDNEFKTVWLADGDGLRDVYTVDDGTSIFSTSWNQKDALDILYVCQGPAFSAAKTVEIYILQGVSGPKDDIDKRRLTAGGFNNAFPSSSPDGTMLVFRSTRDRVHADAADKETQREYKNLFVMNATTGEFGGGGTAKPRQLTDGEWTDTHCSWSPREGCGWIVFSSTRDKPNQKQNVPPLDQGLDPGYFAVYLVNADDLLPDDGKLPAPVRVIRSSPTLAGHINHPVFSPDMRTIVFAADLAAVSCEPISMPLFLHSVRPYGDIFSVDLRDTNDVARNKDIAGFHRITHSRYEYSTPAWAAPADGDDDPNSKWKLPNDGSSAPPPACPYAYPAAGEGWYVAGHITVERRCC